MFEFSFGWVLSNRNHHLIGICLNVVSFLLSKTVPKSHFGVFVLFCPKDRLICPKIFHEISPIINPMAWVSMGCFQTFGTPSLQPPTIGWNQWKSKDAVAQGALRRSQLARAGAWRGSQQQVDDEQLTPADALKRCERTCESIGKMVG